MNGRQDWPCGCSIVGGHRDGCEDLERWKQTYIDGQPSIRRVEFVQSAYGGGFPDTSGTFMHGEPLWLIAKNDIFRLLLLASEAVFLDNSRTDEPKR